MDPKNLKEIADAKFKHAIFRKNLKERIESQLAVAHNGGLFKSTPELMSFLWMWQDNDIVLRDEYDNPIRCDKLKLLEQLKEAYQFAMNAWCVEFEDSKKIRNAKQV